MSITLTSAHSPAWANQEHTAIVCMATFDHCGEVPFSCNAEGDTPHGEEIFARAVAGEFGPIAEYFSPQQTSEQIISEKKLIRQAAVDAIQVTTTEGNTYDGDEVSQGRMARAIMTAQIAGISSATWVLANNVPTVVTLSDLQEALALSMQAQADVWADPYL